MWNRLRVGLNGGTAFGAVGDGSSIGATLVLFDPSTVIAGNQDLRLTVRKIIVDLAGVNLLINAGTVAANDLVAVGYGIYVEDQQTTGTFVDPNLSNAGSERQDWLFMAHTAFLAPGAQPFDIVLTNNAITNNPNFRNNSVEVRSMRKMDQDQRLNLTVAVRGVNANGGNHTITGGNLEGEAFVSVLYERTLRR